jgi:hypothetical protein
MNFADMPAVQADYVGKQIKQKRLLFRAAFFIRNSLFSQPALAGVSAKFIEPVLICGLD